MSHQPAPETNKFYVSLSLTELQALGKVSGEAMRVYVAIASFCFGTKVSTYASLPKIRKRMGKSPDNRRMNRLFEALIEAGLIERYWAHVEGKSKRHFRLPIKAAVVKRLKQEQQQKGEGQKILAEEVKKIKKGGSKLPDINIQEKNKHKYISNNEIINNREQNRIERKDTKKIIVAGNERDLRYFTEEFLKNAWFITFFEKEDQDKILKFLEENRHGVVAKELKKILQEEE